MLKVECEKLKKANLSDIWSVDFMWTGEEFVLIDMALAECSSYWEKYQHLSPQGIDIAKITITENVLPKQVSDWIKQASLFSKDEEEIEKQ